MQEFSKPGEIAFAIAVKDLMRDAFQVFYPMPSQQGALLSSTVTLHFSVVDGFVFPQG
jgi:hypothetical protein